MKKAHARQAASREGRVRAEARSTAPPRKQGWHLGDSERKYSSPLNSTKADVSVTNDAREGLSRQERAERDLPQQTRSAGSGKGNPSDKEQVIPRGKIHPHKEMESTGNGNPMGDRKRFLSNKKSLRNGRF